jgi:hypothetical protein
MSSCPNTNSPEWKSLVGRIGVYEAFREFIKHGNNIPDASGYPETFKGVNATLKVVDALVKIPRNTYPSNNIQGFYNDLVKQGAPKNQIDLLKQHIASQGIKEIDKTELIASLMSELSYTVEVEVAMSRAGIGPEKYDIRYFTLNNTDYEFNNVNGYIKKEEGKQVVNITKEEFEEARNQYETVPSDIYSSMTVAGGVNYRENEIKTPDITPAIRGHAEFATDKGIGWFRSDDKTDNYNEEQGIYVGEGDIITKTRRILEIQSDLFQKGRNREILAGSIYDEYQTQPLEVEKDHPHNQFLQLLNKDNNWVSFFVKSIIQDSARKGYEKVLFPSGDTASKVEGHDSLEEFISYREDRIEELKERLTDKGAEKAWKDRLDFYKQYIDDADENDEEYIKDRRSTVQKIIDEKDKIKKEFTESAKIEIAQMEKEIKEAQEGTLKISIIGDFYEKTIKNILDKRGYKPEKIKDEYGNEWFQVEIDKSRDEDTIYFQLADNQPSKANQATLNRISEWMKRAGIEKRKVDSIVVNGQEIGANGVAKIMEGVAEIVEGKENIALPEEAMHFAVEILKQTNDSLYKRMLGEISQYKIYREVLNSYKDVYKTKDGKPDIQKIKEEAIAKLLVEQVINQNEGITEKPELLQNSRTWWENIIQWFKTLFSKAGFNPFKIAASTILSGEVILQINNEAKPLSEKILSKDFGGLTNLYKDPMQIAYNEGKYADVVMAMYDQLRDLDTMEDRTERMIEGDSDLADEILDYGRKNQRFSYFQLTDKQKQVLTNIDERLRTHGITKVENQNPEDEEDATSYYQRMENGEPIKVKKRVTDFVKDRQDKETIARFENATPEQKKRRKNQAKLGVTGHRDVENIIKAATDENGFLKPIEDVSIPITSGFKLEAYKALSDYLVGTVESPGILYRADIFPTGTIFRTEQIIYDEKRDVAGTIDLLAIQPDGKASVLDWKFIFLNTEKYSDVPFFKQRDIRIQLGQYRQILGTYGVGYNDFHKLEAIPMQIKATFTNDGGASLKELILSSPNVKDEKRRYLLPVPAQDQSTGNETLDKYVQALYGLYETIYKRKGSPEQKEEKIEHLNSISGAIRELQIKQEFAPLYQQANVFLKSTEALIEEYYKDFAGAKQEEVTDAQVNDFLGRLNSTRENLPRYADLYSVFRAIYGDEDLTEEQKQLEDKLSRLSGKASEYIKKIEHIYIGDKSYPGFVPVFVAERETGIKGLEAPEKIVDAMSRDFSIQSLIQTSAMQAAGNIYSNVVQKAAVDKQEALGDFRKLVDAYKGDWNLIVNKKDNTLVRKITYEAHQEFNKATNPTTQNIKWIKENIDIEAFKKDREAYVKKRTEEILKETYPHELDEELNQIRQDRIKQEIAKYSLATDNSLGWFSPKLWNFLKEEKFYTKEYEKLKESPEALALYEFMYKFNRFADRAGYHNGTRASVKTFLPWIKANTYERLKQGAGIKAVYEGFQALAKIHTDEEAHYGKQDPNTGEILKSIPIFFTRKKDDVEYSQDITKNFGLYINSVIDYSYATEVEDKLQAILDVEKSKGRLEVDSNNNIRILEGGKLAEVPDNSRNAELLQGFIDSTIYHERYNRNQFLSPEGVKAAENINKYFRLKVFALNLLTPFVNTFGGNLQATINAGKHWKARDFFKNELKIVQNHFRGSQGNIEKGLLDYFIPLNDDVNRLQAKQLSKDALNKWSLSEVLMTPMRYTDKVIQLATGLTMLENAMLDENGNIISIRDQVRKEFSNRYASRQDQLVFRKAFPKRVNELKETKSLSKIAKFNSEGELEIPGITRKSNTYIEFRRKIQNEIKRINGSLSEEDRRNADRSIVLRSMMMFKNWIPLTVESRYGALKKNTATEEYQMGRARVFWQILSHGAKGNVFKGLTQGITDLKNMTAANEKGLKLLSEYYKRTADSYTKKTGKELEMSPEEFYDMVRQAINSQVRDNLMILSLFSLIVFTKVNSPDDDESDGTKNLYRSTLRVLDKSMDEISFYYNPISFKQIAGGTLIPSVGVLTDALNVFSSLSKETYGIITENEEIEKNAHPTKAILKMIPVASWFTSFVLPIIEPEVAKDLGVKVSSQNRF